MGPGGLRGSEPLLDRGLRPAVAEVFPDRAPEQKRILKHDTEPFAEVAGGEGADVVPVDRDRALLNVVEPGQQVHQRALAGARTAHDADHLAGGDLERHVVKHRLIAVVAKGDVGEADLPLDVVPRLGRRRLVDQGRGVEQFEHPLAPRQETRQPGGEVGEGAQRSVEHRQVGQKGDQLAQRHAAADHVAAADVPDDQAAEAEHDLHRRGVGGVGVFHPLPPAAEVVAGTVKAVELPRFLGEGLDHPDAGEHPGERRHLLAGRIPEPVVPWVDVPPEDPGTEDHQRHRDQREHRELGVDPHEHPAHGHQLHDLEQEAAGDLVHEPVQHLAVVRHAADHRTDLMPVVVRHREALELPHHLLPQRRGDPGADRRGEPAFEGADDGQQHAGKRQGQHDHQQRGLEVGQAAAGLAARGGEDVVDHVLLELGGHELRDDADQRQQAEEHGAPGIGCKQAANPTEDLPLLQAPWAGIVGGLEPEPAGRAGGRIERPVDSLEPVGQPGGDPFPGLVEGPRHFVKPRCQRVGIADQVDPDAVGADLERATADARRRPHPIDRRPGDRPQGVVPVGHREVVGSDDEPFAAGIAGERHVGVDRQQNRPVIQPGGVEPLPDRVGHRRRWSGAEGSRMLMSSGGRADRGVLRAGPEETLLP